LRIGENGNNNSLDLTANAMAKHDGAVVPFAGTIIWVSGDESYKIEDGIQRLEPEWLGKGNNRVLKMVQGFLMDANIGWDLSKSSKL
jgi:hypothetical protein